jgi:hypothetical protein
MPRIDDRANTDNTISDRILEDSRKEQIKKIDRAEFEKKMAQQKAADGRSPLPNISKSEFAKKAIQRFQEQPAGKSYFKEERPTSKTPTKNSTLERNGVRETNKKEDVKKEGIKKEDSKSAKAEKKHEDLALSIAVRQKQDKQDEGGFSEKGSDEFFQAAVNIAVQPMIKNNEAQKMNAPAKIPDAILHQLIDHIFVSINAKGLKQFVIELKDGVLGGGQINVSAQGGKINLKFSGLNDESKKLVRNSKQELANRLRGKNLSLDNFEIV